MKKPKVTPWFNCREHKPVRPGLYEVKFDGVLDVKCRFNGGRWREFEDGDPATGVDRPGWGAKDQWRGLTEPSNG